MAQETAGSRGQYAAATEALRSTARWILGALAAVGAVLVGGLQLSGLGKLGSDEPVRLAVAVIALGGVVVAVGFMVHAITEVLTVEWVTLADFDTTVFEEMLGGRRKGLERAELVEIGHKIDDVRDELYGHVAPSVATLHASLREANALAALVGTPQSPADPEAVMARAERLRAAAREVVDYANYERTRRLFAGIKRRLGLGAIAVVVCVSVFAYATNPPRPSTPPALPRPSPSR